MILTIPQKTTDALEFFLHQPKQSPLHGLVVHVPPVHFPFGFASSDINHGAISELSRSVNTLVALHVEACLISRRPPDHGCRGRKILTFRDSLRVCNEYTRVPLLLKRTDNGDSVFCGCRTIYDSTANLCQAPIKHIHHGDE